MTRTTAPARLIRRSAALAALLALGASGTALADVTGTVTNSAGTPLPGVSVTLTEPDGSSAGFDTTDAAGAYSLSTTGDTPPFTVTATFRDACRDFSVSQLTATVGGLPATAVAPNLVIDPYLFCAPSFAPSGQPEPTGNAWPETGQVLSGPGGITYLRVLAPSAATGFALTLQDGTNVGGGTDESLLTLTAPAANYTGPLNLTYTDAGVTTTRQLATLVSGKVVNPNPPTGSTDLAAIVDVSGSMSGADPTFRRKDAVQLLVDLSSTGDRLVATGFDDGFVDIFGRTTITTPASRNPLKTLARQRIVNAGGTNYDIGLGGAYTALSADPLNPATPKTAIFLTDGAHNGTYQNSHLRFAFNGTGQSWPVCVVQLGRSFSATDTARLKRIAAETGGTFSATSTNSALENLYFQCSGRSTGATTLLKKTANYRVGQTRAYARKVKKGQRKATFFVSWGTGRYRLAAVQPGGKVYRRTVKNVRLVRGKTFQFIEVRNPKAGLWRLRVTRLPTGGTTDRATTTVTVQKKR
ncbi:MAG: hypothetical protein AB7V62_01010 [Thermoleophilia bacterium]